jgi:hypothetical protein
LDGGRLSSEGGLLAFREIGRRQSVADEAARLVQAALVDAPAGPSRLKVFRFELSSFWGYRRHSVSGAAGAVTDWSRRNERVILPECVVIVVIVKAGFWGLL